MHTARGQFISQRGRSAAGNGPPWNGRWDHPQPCSQPSALEGEREKEISEKEKRSTDEIFVLTSHGNICIFFYHFLSDIQHILKYCLKPSFPIVVPLQSPGTVHHLSATI